MQISVDVHNYMETLVGQVLARDYFVERYDSEQLADLACLALVQLKPIYIRYDIDFLSALPETRLVHFKRNCEIAIKNAEELIINDRRKNRTEEVPVVFSHVTYGEDAPLEWFETPLINIHNPSTEDTN